MKRLLILTTLLTPMVAHAQAASNFFTGYLALGTGNSTFTEVEPLGATPVPSVGYTRQAITLGPQGNDGKVTNLAGVSFGADTASNWGTISELAIYDAPTGGNLIAWWGTSPQSTVNVGGTYTIATGAINLTLARGNEQTVKPFAQTLLHGSAIGVAVTGTTNVPVTTTVTAGVDDVISNGVIAASPYPNSVLNTAVVPHAHNHWAVVGDSWVQQASTQVDLQQPLLSSAGMALLDVLCNQCFYFDPANDNFGYPGGYSINILNQMATIQARHPDVILVQTGHNAIQAFGNTGGVLVEEQNYPIIIQALRAAGIEPVTVLEQSINSVQSFTQTTSGDSNALYNYRMTINQLNRWKTQYDRVNGVREVDYWTPTITSGDVNNSVKSSFSDDGVHLNYAGNFAIQSQSLVDLAAILPSRTVVAPQFLAGDTYDATFNPLGNLLANGLFTSTGSISATNITGTGPTGMTFLLASGMQSAKTATGSTPAAGTGYGNAFQIAITGSTTAASSSDSNVFFVFSSTPGLAANSVVECSVDTKVSANSPFAQVFAKLVTQQSGGANDNGSVGNLWGSVAGVPNGGNPNTNGPTTAWSGRIRVPPVKLNYANETLTFYLQLDWNDSSTGSNGAFTGTAQFSNMTCRQVLGQSTY